MSTTQYQNAVLLGSQVPFNSNQYEDQSVDFYSLLNGMRVSFKKKILSTDLLGEIAVNELLQQHIANSQDNRFQQIVNKYGVTASGGNIDYLVYEHHQFPKSPYHGFTPIETKQAFEKAFDDMINGVFRMRLLQSHQYTHVAFACVQTGPKNDVFKVAALATKKCLSIEAIVQSCTGMRSANGIMIIGRVIEPTKKPCLLVVNRGTPQQIVVGPNRMGYNPEEGEFRIGIPEEYQSKLMSQVLPNSIFEVFITTFNDQTFIYGQGQDLPQSNSQIDGEIGISEIMPDQTSPQYSNRVVTRNDSLQTVFNMKDILIQCGIQASFISSGENPMFAGLRTTQTQILREQNGNGIKFNNQYQGYNGISNSTNVPINFNRSQSQMVLNPNSNMMKPLTFNAPQQFKPTISMAQSIRGNENLNPNLQPSNNTFSLQQSKAIAPIKFNLNAPGISQPMQIPTSAYSRFNTVQQQQEPQIKFNFAVPNSQQQQPSLIKTPIFNPPLQQFSQPINRSQTYNFSAPQQQPKITYKFGGNASSFQKQETVDQTMISTSENKRPLVFNELSPIDQQTLQGYLKELQEDLNSEQFQRVTALMLTDPVKFYQYFQIAHEQLQIVSKKGGDSAQSVNKTKEEEIIKQKEMVSKQLREYDDMTLFLLTMPQSLMEGRDDKMKLLIDKVKAGEFTAREVIRKVIVRSAYPVNESFESMLHNIRDTADMILELRCEEYPCHKIVITATSEYFKKALKENEYINKYQNQVRGPYRQKLIVPDWIDPKALKLFINYIYTGKFGFSQEARSRDQIDPLDILNLLKIGNFFYHQFIQEQLIADLIIPNINPQQAIHILKECYTQLEDNVGIPQTHRKSCTFAWNFLYEYSQFYLQKHLSSLLRSTPQLAYELPGELLRKIIDKSLLYVVDGGSRDLEIILQFTADTWTNDRSITTLFKKSQQSMDSCSAFHYQNITQMSDFINQIDPKLDYQCRLIRDEDLLKPSLQACALDSLINTDKNGGSDKQMIDQTFQNPGSQNAKLIAENGEEIDIASWKPSSNIIKQVANTDEIFDKEAQYQTVIQLDEPAIKSTFEKNKGMSVFSKAFDFGRRSWMLKLDIDSENNVSAFIVERGAPLGGISQQTDHTVQLGLTVPIRFSSLLVQFEIVDPAFGDHKSYIFYSFAHDQHQVIGHDHILNLSQLQNKNQLKVKVHMKEFLMHSALMWHISQNFQELYSKDLKQMELYKKNQWSAYTYQNTHGGAILKDYELLGLRFYNIYQLLVSHQLKVESENTVLGFLYHYTKVQLVKQSSKQGLAFITDLLTSTGLRLYFVSTCKILSSLRDNDSLRNSRVFLARVQEEFQQRAALPYSQLIVLNQQKKIVDSRKHYDLSKVEGRKKYESANKSTVTGSHHSIFIEELIDWLKTSKHDKKTGQETQSSQGSSNINEIYAKQEIIKLQALYYEERRKCSDLQGTINRLERRNDELEKLLGQDHWGVNGGARPIRRSFSNDNLRRGLTSNDQRGYYSPKNQTRKGAYISNNEILGAAGCTKRGANYGGLNNSFDQSVFYSMKNSQEILDDTYKVVGGGGHIGGGSTAKADKKVIANQHADLTRLLSKLDRGQYSPPGRPRPPQVTSYRPATNNGYQEQVPYYRQKRQNNDDGECLIF